MPFARTSQRLYGHLRTFCTSQARAQQPKKLLVTAGICTLCGVGLASKYIINQHCPDKTKTLLSRNLYAASPAAACDDKSIEEEEKTPDVYQHARERRFYEFASVVVDGDRYMTAQDFLESVTDEEARPRVGLRRMTRDELKTVLKLTPDRSQASSSLFRKIHQNGVISYSEYLFLLCILTKPKAGFKIAFKMFDTDGNERVDKQEFLVLEEIFRNKTEKSRVVKEFIFSSDVSQRVDITQIISSKGNAIHDTSLLVHFFGPKGDQVLSYEDFYQFMDNLQTEVLELEFMTYSHGMPTISEEDFARVLLRYTDVFDEDEYYEKLHDRIPEEKGLNFGEFKSFFQFLNNLEDFAISINMYTVAGRPIGEEEFQRAVKVTTGQELSSNLVHTLYQLFDKDGDGKLSYVEFIGVMKDRLHRGFRSHLMKHVGWIGFKKCVKHNIKMSAK